MLTSVINEINQAKTIIVAGHILPDGDDISSVVSLTMGLLKYGKNAIGVIDDEIPAYLEEIGNIKDYIRDFECIKNNPADLIIIVDASSPDRVGRVQELFNYRRLCVIDHHATNLNYGHANYVDKNSASTAQLVMNILNELNVEYDRELATMNLLGICTDTGFFKYSNTNEKVLLDAANLISKGGELSFITNAILENQPLERLMLMKDVLQEMRFANDNSIVYSYVSAEMLEKYNIKSKDTPQYVGDLRSIKNVEVAIVFNEHEKNNYHVSMRSKKWFDISKIAVKYGGGGHPRAAGFSANTENIHELMKKVVEDISILMNQQN